MVNDVRVPAEKLGFKCQELILSYVLSKNRNEVLFLFLTYLLFGTGSSQF